MIDRWFPVARSDDAIPRHVVQTALLGQELALWRDDAGRVNAWENRCPHRGVRLSIGHNLGDVVRCQYHGWRFASGTGQCVFVPAHPEQKPANVLRAKTYGVGERYGYVWVNLAGAKRPLYTLDLNNRTPLRSVFVNAPATVVAEQLIASYRPDPDGPALEAIDSYIIGIYEVGTILLQPVNDGQTQIHALLPEAVAEADRIATLRRHNARLTAFRDRVEALAA
jgi:nitrite reductase/ring-hydroxylating ferredoxin subunit